MSLKKIEKLTLIIALFVFCVYPLFATDIKADGVGSSIDEARVKARNNLSEYINGVFIQATTETSSYADSGTSKNTFSSSSNASSSGYLKAIEYENEHNDKDTYYSTATIKDNATNISVFKDQLKNSKATIESLYGSLPKQSNEQKKNTLITIYASLTEYEAYRTILIYMGHSDLIPELSINISTTSIFIEYQNIIIEEGYALEEKEKLITDETEHQKLLEELSANRTEQRRLEKEKNEAAIAREEAAKQALAERLKQYASLTQTKTLIATTTDEERYSNLRTDIFTARQNFLDACTQYDNLCKEQFALIDKDYEAEKTAVEARPYRYAELQGSEPTPVAKKVRDDEIDYLYTLKELHKVAVLKQIRTSMFYLIKARYDEYCNCISAIKGKTFEIVLKDETIDTITTSFDSINVTWAINIKLKNIEDLANNNFSFSLSYKQLTGKDVQDPKYRGQQGYDEYMKYLDSIDYLDVVIRSFANSFRISLKFVTNADKEDYGIAYEGIDFNNIQFVLESNALNNSDWVLIVDSIPSSVDNFALSWTLPGYSRTFNGDLNI